MMAAAASQVTTCHQPNHTLPLARMMTMPKAAEPYDGGQPRNSPATVESHLPPELLQDILAYLPQTTLKCSSLVCHRWAALSGLHLFHNVHISSHPSELVEFLAALDRPRLPSFIKELHISKGVLAFEGLAKILQTLPQLSLLWLSHGAVFAPIMPSSVPVNWTRILRRYEPMPLSCSVWSAFLTNKRRRLDTVRLHVSSNPALLAAFACLLEEIVHLEVNAPLGSFSDLCELMLKGHGRLKVYSLVIRNAGVLDWLRDTLTLLHAIIDISHLHSVDEQARDGVEQAHLDVLLQFEHLEDIHIPIAKSWRPLSFLAFSNLTTLRLHMKALLTPWYHNSTALLRDSRDWAILAATANDTPTSLRNLYINLTLTNQYLPWADEHHDRAAFDQFTFKIEKDFYPQLRSLHWRLLDSSIDIPTHRALQKIHVCIALVNVWCKGKDSDYVSYDTIEKDLQEMIPRWCSDNRHMQRMVKVSLQHN